MGPLEVDSLMGAAAGGHSSCCSSGAANKGKAFGSCIHDKFLSMRGANVASPDQCGIGVEDEG